MSKGIKIEFEIPKGLECLECDFVKYHAGRGIFSCRIFETRLDIGNNNIDTCEKCDQCIKKYGTGEEIK